MAYSESGVPIPIDGYFSPGGYVTKQYLFDAYPQLSDQAKSAGLWGCGYALVGQLGDRTSVDKSSPVQTISGGANWKQVTSSWGPSAAAIKTDGTLWLWGYNAYGELGNNNTNSVSSPVQTISAGTNWIQVGAGDRTFGAIKTDGTLWMWGKNNSGQLGDNTATNRSSPVQTVSGGTNWKYTTGGDLFMSAIKTDGTLWLWGDNGNGQLGTNNTTNRSSPVQTISAGTNWKQVSAGGSTVAAIKTDGTLWLWGFNGYGGLGDNTSVRKSSPVQTVSGGNNWKQCSVSSYNHIASIKTNGTLWLWGNNNYGQLGTNNTTNTSSPVQTISAGTNWKQVSTGNYSTYSLKTDGTLWTWGANFYGNLGTNNTTHYSSPVQTVSGGTNWKQISGGTGKFFAIKDFNEDF